MSLRAFHIVFIVASIILTVGFAICLKDRLYQAVCLGAAAGMAVYLGWFIRKHFNKAKS